MKTDIEIAYDAKVKPIKDIAASIGLSEEDIDLYGKYIAKVPLESLDKFKGNKDGKLVMVTAITPTPAGEGKTVTTISLIQGLGRLGKNVVGALREPSIGPTFGIKGGATGGGYAQVYPMWDIDLHFRATSTPSRPRITCCRRSSTTSWSGRTPWASTPPGSS